MMMMTHMIHDTINEFTTSTSRFVLGQYERGLTIMQDADGHLIVKTESAEVPLLPMDECETFAVGDGRMTMAVRFEDSAVTLYALGSQKKGQFSPTLTLKKVM